MRANDVKRHLYYGTKTLHISRDEAYRRVECGLSRPITRGYGDNIELLGIKDVEPVKMRDQDPTSITSSEMLTNAVASIGMAKSKTAKISAQRKEDENIDPDYVEAATSKVSMWPAVFDHKAVCIRLKDEDLESKLFTQRPPSPAEYLAANKRLEAFA